VRRWNVKNLFLVFLVVFLLSAPGNPAAAVEAPEGKPSPEELARIREEAMHLLQSKQYEDAVRKYYILLKANPEDSNALYNMACACSLLDKRDYAVEFLRRSVEAGFLDFDHIKKDPDLAPIRDHEGYLEILKSAADYLRKADERREQRYRKKLGDRYLFLKDEKYRLLMITNVGESRARGLMGALRRYADALWRDFFKFKPDYMITVLIPQSSDDYRRDFGGRGGAAGFYNHGSRTLTVNLSTGTGTMIHEFTHALHYGDMMGLGKRHPIWIIEGFGSLYEQCRILPDGKAVGLTNWRLTRNLHPALIDKTQTYIPWKKLMDPKSGVFRNRSTISMAYAVARYIFYFMQEKGVLRKFYRLYRERYAEDPSGAKFVEEVLGGKMEDLEKEWIPWVKKLTYGRPGAAPRPRVRLGVYLGEAEEGVGVSDVVEGSCAEKAGIRTGDVIVSADGKALRNRGELISVLLKKKPGDKMSLRIRRGEKEIELEVTLDAR
jgi:hypothetical protein